MTDEPFKVRASSWGSLFDCAHRWEGTHILKIRGTSSPRSLLGTAIHAATAHYDNARLQGDMEYALQDAGEVFIGELDNPREPVSWRGSDLTRADAERIGLTLVGRYASQIAPRFNYTAVEMTLKPMVIDCGSGVKIELTGSMDRARVIGWEGGVGIADIKTGARATQWDEAGRNVIAKTKGFGAQIGTYELLYEHTTGEVVTAPGEIIGMNTGSKPEIAVSEIKDARRLLVGTEHSPGLLQYASAMFRTGLFPPNPSSVLCSERFCNRWSTCPYHD